MNRPTFMTTFFKAAAFACVAMAALGSTAGCTHPAGSETPRFTLGVFNFDFARLGDSVAAQLDAIEEMGYTGITLNVTEPNQRKRLAEYQENLDGRDLQIYAGYIVADVGPSNDALYPVIDETLRILARSNSALWLIVRDRVEDRSFLLEAIGTIADMAKAAGVELVLYPHDNLGIETAEEALGYVKELGREDIGISLHLCHEIRGGNGDRLTEVAQVIKPYLRLPSISGAAADSAGDTREDGWDRTIQPLDQGDYDASQLLEALDAVGYTGPVILHTFGLQKVEADHHERSIARFNEMVDSRPDK